jgi:hypothetical protein
MQLTEALNAPWLLLFMYALGIVSLVLNVRAVWRLRYYTGTEAIFHVWWVAAIAALLLGAGLALVGAAYLHDVWYC